MKATMRTMENFILLKLVGFSEGVGVWSRSNEEVIDDTELKNGYQLGFPRSLYTSFCTATSGDHASSFFPRAFLFIRSINFVSFLLSSFLSRLNEAAENLIPRDTLMPRSFIFVQ